MKSPALRYHGAKFRLAPWVLGFFPEHTRYVEPFGGAAGVLLQKKPCYAEVYNDLDGEIVNFFRVLRDPEQCSQLIEACLLTPYARDEFDDAFREGAGAVERARRLAVRAAMGFGSAGATKGTTGLRVDSNRQYAHAAHLWARYPEQLSLIGKRLAGVFIENRPAVDVLRQHDCPDTLHYCDPPYVLSTRDPRAARSGSSYYRHEMDDTQHEELLAVLKDLHGMVVVSGYSTSLYEHALAGWERHTTQARISAGRGTDMREEVLWLSPAASEALRRPLFQHGLDLALET